MQVLLLGLFVALYLHDATTQIAVRADDGGVRMVESLHGEAWPYLGPLPVALIVLGPKLLLLLIYQTACLRTFRKLGREGGQRALDRLEKLTAALPLTLLLLFVADLWLGGLRVLRAVFQHTVLIDELLILLPTLIAAVLAWRAYYPVDRRLREAVILRLVDEGRPIYPLLTRGQYISMQVRHQFGLLLLPLLVIFAWNEALTLLGPDHRGVLSKETAMMLIPIGVLMVFVLAPLVIRYVWHTTALPPGEVRERMLALCRQHRVKVRELLLWRTGGGLVNAAVTGLLAPVRFILLSDGLLAQVPPKQVEAVMAHELAHVKCRHIIWMGLVLIATLGLTELAGHYALDQWLSRPGVHETAEPMLIDLHDPQVRVLAVGIPAFMITLFIFGWVSRRIERQADVFAARHMTLANSEISDSRDATHRRDSIEKRPDETTDPEQEQSQTPTPATRSVAAIEQSTDPRFTKDAIQAMIGALQRVAELNHAPVERKSWRHGSIAWRQAHLRSLIGTPVDNTPVDRTLNKVKIATLLAMLLLSATYLL